MEFYALIISIFSAILAAFALGWNIYRDIVLKPKLRIRFSVKTFLKNIQKPQGLYLIDPLNKNINLKTHNGEFVLTINVVNHGPGIVRINNAVLAKSYIKCLIFKNEYNKALFIEDQRYTKLPKSLKVAEEAQLIFPLNKTTYTNLKEFSRIGVTDSFSREHYVDNSNLKQTFDVIEKLLNENVINL